MLFTFCSNCPHTAEPHSPSNLDIAVDGLNLVATWTEPFSLDGEEISYVISITNMATGSSEEHTVNETRFIFSRAASQRDCQEYEFTVFSQNSFSKSNDSVSGKRNFPTGNNALTVFVLFSDTYE